MSAQAARELRSAFSTFMGREQQANATVGDEHDGIPRYSTEEYAAAIRY
ncbi:MAG: hypothetical protein KTR32_19185 [Granulosicoccus sp.]|nr:hypothetical protein [Granulosicoccus sp.]